MSPAKADKGWEPLKRWSMLTGAVSATFAVLIGGANFFQVFEPHWPATRHFVRDQVSQVDRRTLSTEIAIKEADRRAVQSQVDRMEVELRKLPPNQESLRDLMGEQIRRYTDQFQKIDGELEDLRRLQSGRRP